MAIDRELSAIDQEALSGKIESSTRRARSLCDEGRCKPTTARTDRGGRGEGFVRSGSGGSGGGLGRPRPARASREQLEGGPPAGRERRHPLPASDVKITRGAALLSHHVASRSPIEKMAPGTSLDTRSRSACPSVQPSVTARSAAIRFLFLRARLSRRCRRPVSGAAAGNEPLRR